MGSPFISNISILRWLMSDICIPVTCLQCEDPICATVCPLGAINKDPNTGVVKIDQDTCVGCKLCIYTCPVGAISIDPIQNVISKCNLCDGNPACVKYCPTGAISYVDRDKITNRLKRSKAEKIIKIYQKEFSKKA
jgi:Fe-S-cluster-containing dehydrogenase component